MTAALECIHGLTPASCTICIHGPTPRATPPQTSSCRSCGADVIWVETEKGKRMPIDAEPSATGRFALSEDGRTVSFRRANPSGRVDLYCSHFETCPDSDDWRRSR